MSRSLHLVIGPDQHGVVRHAVDVAAACGDDLLRCHDAAAAEVPGGYDVVHIPFTDRLFGPSAEAAGTAFDHVCAAIAATGARLSVTLHDVPHGDDDLARRRRRTYQSVTAGAAGIVVASFTELSDAQELGDHARSRRVIPLPVVWPGPGRCEPAGAEVAVLGFVFPDRGYEQVITALPEGMEVLALGRAADGHEDLPTRYDLLARRAGHRWQLTGFLADADLAERLRTVAVPVAPNRRTAASASVATWLAHGRRPLVPDSAYTRELVRAWPGTLTLYSPDEPDALRSAVMRAHAQPESTVLDPDVRVGPTLADVASEYRAHLAACAAPALIRLDDGRAVVPDNRWDLLEGLRPASPPRVTVVIPYYEAQGRLDLVLHALTRQTHPAAHLEVVVADDGSRRPPDLGAARNLDVRVVRQADRGFRAAAARNLGAAAAAGDVLLFLDGDTVPEPTYVERMARLPGLMPDALVVGRRRHADLHQWTPGHLDAWLNGTSEPPAELTEPAWLREEYLRSGNLLDVNGRSYRYVISAVLGMHRDLFAEIGGFNEAFVGYGGEDWELAHRAYVAGAVFAHVSDAVAWHDGPEWAERPGDHAAEKAAETTRLDAFVPDHVIRDPRHGSAYPAVVIRMPASSPSRVRQSARSGFGAGVDCGFWLTGPAAEASAAAIGDTRLHVGRVPTDALARARFILDLSAPVDLAGLPDLLGLAEGVGEIRTEAGKLRATRARSRARRHAPAFKEGADTALPVLFGRRDVSAARLTKRQNDRQRP